jgi:hypothetical protein
MNDTRHPRAGMTCLGHWTKTQGDLHRPFRHAIHPSLFDKKAEPAHD